MKRIRSTNNTAIYGKNFLCMCRHGFKYEELKIDTWKSFSFKVYGNTPSTFSVLTVNENYEHLSVKYHIHVIFTVQCLLNVSFLKMFLVFIFYL